MALNPIPSKVLLNAEPFGFGPTAAIASFFPFLRPHINTLGYMGEGHTLDLQTPLKYDHIHNTAGLNEHDLIMLMQKYDVFVTAMDFQMAQLAQKAGLKTIIYDALTWFWKDVPPAVVQADLYLSQNFLGVADKLAAYAATTPCHLVSPILQQPTTRHPSPLVLVNLGGLISPFLSPENAACYANKMYEAIAAVTPPHMQMVVCTSQLVADKLPAQANAASYSRSDILDLLAKSSLAFMTSGLGNIYDAAQFDLPTIWLPPTNDSQGQQVDALQHAGLVDSRIDWHHVSTAAAKIDYAQPQPQVMAEIISRIHALDTGPLTEHMAHCYDTLESQSQSKTTHLLELFGCYGAQEVATHILRYLKASHK